MNLDIGYNNLAWFLIDKNMAIGLGDFVGLIAPKDEIHKFFKAQFDSEKQIYNGTNNTELKREQIMSAVRVCIDQSVKALNNAGVDGEEFIEELINDKTSGKNNTRDKKPKSA